MNRIPLDIRVGELHVWIADLDEGGDERAHTRGLESLSVEERERAARFVNPRDGERWAQSRALLRMLLGGYLGAKPAELRFELGEHGKPRLASGSELHFNLSHSGGLGLYAFALDGEVGCDVETTGRDINVLAVAGRAFGQEVAQRLGCLDEEQRRREFLRAWVRHEAHLKCLGVGFGGTTKERESECSIVDVEVDEPAAAAVATKHAPAKVKLQRAQAIF
ncbi:MAG: 4'-phosphopantetheinyl transferase family protein [Solirubrobacteraceae bacterium]